jgi:hypothetical protein
MRLFRRGGCFQKRLPGLRVFGADFLFQNKTTDSSEAATLTNFTNKE